MAEGRGRDVVTRDACLASWVRSDLAALRWHWSGAYCIDVSVHGDRQAWTAGRRDGRRVLSAGSQPELREKIRADYIACPVARDVAPSLPRAAERPAGHSQHER